MLLEQRPADGRHYRKKCELGSLKNKPTNQHRAGTRTTNEFQQKWAQGLCIQPNHAFASGKGGVHLPQTISRILHVYQNQRQKSRAAPCQGGSPLPALLAMPWMGGVK
jgi:hypothetical protein